MQPDALQFGDVQGKARVEAWFKRNEAFEARVRNAMALLRRRGQWPEDGSILRAYPDQIHRHCLIVCNEAARRLDVELEQAVRVTRRANRYGAGGEIAIPPAVHPHLRDVVLARISEDCEVSGG